MTKLAIEYQGFIKFITRANHEILKWYGPHCNYNPQKIALMAAREWDGMADEERKFFIKAQQLDSREKGNRAPTGTNPFLCYLMHKRYKNTPSKNYVSSYDTFPKIQSQFARSSSEEWKKMSSDERGKYAGIQLPDMGISHVIEKRDKLHELYAPGELTKLEFIIKTKPKKPLNSRAWFLTMENHSIKSSVANEQWRNIVKDDKRLYEECSKLDKKRYNYERSTWITKLLTLDLSKEDLTLEDFESQRARSNVETLSSIIESNKNLVPSSIKTKRPLSAFSLFIKDYSAKIKHMTSSSKFGQHLKDAAEEWAKLSDKEKQPFKDASERLSESYRTSKLVYYGDHLCRSDPYEISAALYRHSKTLNGPSRPSHLLKRIPSIYDFYGQANKIQKKERRYKWESLPDGEKKRYSLEYERMKTEMEAMREELKSKYDRLEELLNKADELENLKKDLRLLSGRSMVAPTRTPQARGVKCDLCKKILASATWLDQTKLAKKVEDARAVLELIRKHNATECPCIPKNIENLLIGSTHFEIHRLVAKCLDAQVNKKQCDYYCDSRQKAFKESTRRDNINDCTDTHKTSRFNVYAGRNDPKHSEKSNQQLKHLSNAIDFWNIAMEDQANPFNSKLALRLGLTHHVIYACYLFKYYKILDYQLIAANLLLNVFKSIEGVTANAILHASYLLVKTLLDCNQHHLARQCLKQATKISNYQDKTHYESILLTCASCELRLLDNDDAYNVLKELAELAVIQPNDKLQHYYARTLAVSVIIKYIHCYRNRSDVCFEFYHAYRYMCAIIRRCYDSSFELVLSEKDFTKQQQQMKKTGEQENQILDHSWIRFAVCDFVFSTFDLLSKFYTRTGQPESLELLYNGLNLVAYRNGSCYWQSRLAAIGAGLDILCDKHEHATTKLDTMSSIIDLTSDPHLKNFMQLDHEVSLLSLLNHQDTVIKKEIVLDLLQRIKIFHHSLMNHLCQIELYECKSNAHFKMTSNSEPLDEDLIIIGNNVGHLSLTALKIFTSAMLKVGSVKDASQLITALATRLNNMNCNVLEYNDCQTILNILLHFADLDKSEQLLLETIASNKLFLEVDSNLVSIESQLSMLTISDSDIVKSGESCTLKKTPTKSKTRVSRMALGRHSRRRGTYDVASKSEENLYDRQPVRFFDTIEAVKNFSSLSKEEIVVTYLRNSEPNPDYLLYRRAHELMFSFRLKDVHPNQDQLLYHFCESSTSNTMRYRWMMFDEQQASPFEPPTSTKKNTSSSSSKHLGFSDVLVNIEKTVKSFKRIISEDYKLLQIKYIIDKKCKYEHLLIVCFDSVEDPVYIHARKPITSDDFFEDARAQIDDLDKLCLPNRFNTKVEDAKRTLFINNHRSRTELRKKIEGEIGVLLHDLENDWLGPFRFLLCGKTNDAIYNTFIEGLIKDILIIMHSYSCNSIGMLRSALQNAPSNREEFCQLIAILFNCPSTCNESRDCFNKWLKSMESFVADQSPNLDKKIYLQSLTRGQVGLILDRHLELIPFESLPVVRIMRQGIFRVPSLRLFNMIASRNGGCCSIKVSASSDTVYVLDPANNLSKTRERFESKLKSQIAWNGTISQPPTTDQLEQWFASKEVYIFIGHGAGATYYNRLCKGRGLSAMPFVKPVSIVMGCSSGRVMAEGPRLESFGLSWAFILRGSPAYVGLLWDVTDTDIDRFLDSLLKNWIGLDWGGEVDNNESGCSTTNNHSLSVRVPITEAIAQARHVCELKLLVGSTPVTYGLPVWCK